ncbi:hypothetical protein P7K49_040586 [Saguinus oedipus]|uniref:Uncharacterized protein n=1 Tax=Saguinus oedipus TaxID=9490 RepID=A0ABQ9TAK1_SAGOE|nr:hypothetical protein P7K49_040586 [Saguinus oedipus]
MPVLGCSRLSESYPSLANQPSIWGAHRQLTCLPVKDSAGASAPSTNLAFAGLPTAVPLRLLSSFRESYPSLANQPSIWGAHWQLACLPVKDTAGASALSTNLAFAGLPVAVPVLGCSRLSESYPSLAKQPSTSGVNRQFTCLPVKDAAGASAHSMNLAFAGLPAAVRLRLLSSFTVLPIFG